MMPKPSALLAMEWPHQSHNYKIYLLSEFFLHFYNEKHDVTVKDDSIVYEEP